VKVPIAVPDISKADVRTVARAVQEGEISGKGRYVHPFEAGFARWLGARHAVATTNGTAALHLAMASLGIGPGDEVVIPAFSMAAIPFAVSYAGDRSVLVDSDRATWNVDAGGIEEKITRRTKAIVVMHTFGNPAQMDPILEVAGKHGLYVIEDAAEAHGAEYKGRKLGTFGDVGCFSFYANKIITTGEGGMLVTSSKGISKTAMDLRDMAFGRGRTNRFAHRQVGFNYRLSSVLCALGLSQLKRIDAFVRRRRAAATLYTKLLKRVPGVTTPVEPAYGKSAFWMYSVLVDPVAFRGGRGGLMRALERSGIETRPFFVPVHMQPAFQSLYRGERYPGAEYMGRSGLNLPSGNTLTRRQIEYVARAISRGSRG
jgi:perosamine synthetase